MTPKQKADEIADKYYFSDIFETITYEQAKQCALIAVDGIIEQYEYIGTYLPEFAKQHIEFCNAVKKEL